MNHSTREVTRPSGQIHADWSQSALVDWQAIAHRLWVLLRPPYEPSADPIEDNARRIASGLPARRGKWAHR